MAITCDILLTNNANGEYRAGQVVQGVVNYAVDKPTEFTSITVSLRGIGSCRWLGGWNHMGSTCIGTEDHVDERMNLIEEKKSELAARTYEKEFRFVLPETIPSSYKDSRCVIEYYLELEFLSSNGTKFSKRLDLNVQGGTKPLPEQQPTTYEAILENPSSNETIAFNIEIEETHLNPGKTIKIQLDTKNLSGINTFSIRGELIECITYKSNCNHKKQTTKTVNGCEGILYDEQMKNTYSGFQSIVTTAEMFTVHSNILTRDYTVKVNFKLPPPYKEVHVEIPIVLAEEIEVSEEVKAVDLPPSYSQVMNQEEKETEKQTAKNNSIGNYHK